eukprot:6706544-Lingulodinium_polyedra.AAC.1
MGIARGLVLPLTFSIVSCWARCAKIHVAQSSSLYVARATSTVSCKDLQKQHCHPRRNHRQAC